jgi:hypothetical protein
MDKKIEFDQNPEQEALKLQGDWMRLRKGGSLLSLIHLIDYLIATIEAYTHRGYVKEKWEAKGEDYHKIIKIKEKISQRAQVLTGVEDIFLKAKKVELLKQLLDTTYRRVASKNPLS